jgi:hypothetical protein
MNTTTIVEETQQLTPEGTNIDRPTEVQAQQNQDAETLNEAQLENIEAAPKVNGMVTNHETEIEPDESQITVSDHPPKETVEDITSCPEWYSETQPGAIGTSHQPPPLKKDKQ